MGRAGPPTRLPFRTLKWPKSGYKKFSPAQE
jgi:hypothetical protein